MKRSTILLFVILGIVNAAAFVYLYQRQNETEASVADNLLKNIEERQQIEEGFRREMESKHKDQEFVMQQEQQRQLQEFRLQVEELTAGLEASNKKSEESAKLLGAANKKLAEAIRQAQDNATAQAQRWQSSLAEYAKKTDAQLAQLDGTHEQLNKDLSYFANSFNAKLNDYETRLTEYHRTMQALISQNKEPAPTPVKTTPGG